MRRRQLTLSALGVFVVVWVAVTVIDLTDDTPGAGDVQAASATTPIPAPAPTTGTVETTGDVTPKRKIKNPKAYRETNSSEIRVESLPPRTIPVIDIHEHVRDMAQVPRLLKYMDKYKIERICLQAASLHTLTLSPQKYGFEGFKENNEELLRIEKAHPKRFCSFVTIFPPDEGNLALLKDYVVRGADGLKLYLGHGAKTGKEPFHIMPLDDPRMMEIYAWAEQTQFPILMHINFIKYFDEFVRVMEAHPYLRITVPHFGLHKNTAKRLERVSWLFDRYPNFFTDMSLGFHTFHRQGFEAMSTSRTRSQAFLTRHADRIMFATDMVLDPSKTEEYIDEVVRSYLQWLEMDSFRFFMQADRLMKGFALPPEVLYKMYQSAPRRYLMTDENGDLPKREDPAWQPPIGLPPTVDKVEPLRPAISCRQNASSSVGWQKARLAILMRLS